MPLLMLSKVKITLRVILVIEGVCIFHGNHLFPFPSPQGGGSPTLGETYILDIDILSENIHYFGFFFLKKNKYTRGFTWVLIF